MEAHGLSRTRHAVSADAREVGDNTWLNPFPFHVTPRNPVDALRARLDSAPEEHAAAVLAAYDVLQELHDRGVLDVVRSGLAASDELLETAGRAA